MDLTIKSFGWKFGKVGDGKVIDCRGLRDPSKIKALRKLSGLDPAVARRIIESPEAQLLILEAIEHYDKAIEAGDKKLTICFGCQYGKHRSVALAEQLMVELAHENPTLKHMDLHEWKPPKT